MLTGHETIADLAKKGDGLRISCVGCGKLTEYPFRLLLEKAPDNAEEPIAFVLMRLRCQTCSTPVTVLKSVSLWRMQDGKPRYD